MTKITWHFFSILVKGTNYKARLPEFKLFPSLNICVILLFNVPVSISCKWGILIEFCLQMLLWELNYSIINRIWLKTSAVTPVFLGIGFFLYVQACLCMYLSYICFNSKPQFFKRLMVTISRDYVIHSTTIKYLLY